MKTGERHRREEQVRGDVLILDFNGVIVNDERLHFETFRDVLLEEGLRLDRETYERDYLGMGNDRIAFEQAVATLGAGKERRDIDGLVGRKQTMYRERAARGLTLVDGVVPFVRAAAKRARIVVVSGAWREEVEFGLAKAGLSDVVETVVAAEDITVGKPDPEGLRLALEKIGANGGGRRAIVIEDSLPGLAAARALGAGCVMIASSHGRSKLEAADAVWDSFEGHTPDELEPLWRAL